MSALLRIGEDGVGRDPAQEHLCQFGREGVLGVEGAVGQVVAVSPLDQQLQRHLMAVYLVPAHRHRDVLVEGPASQPEHVLLFQAVLAGPVRQPAILHHHAHIVGRVWVIRLMHSRHLPLITSHRHVAPLLGHHRQRPLVGHQMRVNGIALRLIDGAHYVQIDAMTIGLAETGPVIAIDMYQVGPKGPGEQQTAQQEKRSNHVSVFLGGGALSEESQGACRLTP
ncbi:hypothetical protein D3C79_749560 [compost metagenome]